MRERETEKENDWRGQIERHEKRHKTHKLATFDTMNVFLPTATCMSFLWKRTDGNLNLSTFKSIENINAHNYLCNAIGFLTFILLCCFWVHVISLYVSTCINQIGLYISCTYRQKCLYICHYNSILHEFPAAFAIHWKSLSSFFQFVRNFVKFEIVIFLPINFHTYYLCRLNVYVLHKCASTL